MKGFITFVLMTAGVLFVSGLVAHHFPQVRTTAFNLPDPNADIGGTFPVSYWLLFLIVMAIMAFWANGKKGRR